MIGAGVVFAISKAFESAKKADSKDYKNIEHPKKYNDISLTINLDIKTYDDYQSAIRKLSELKDYKKVTDDKTMPILLDATDQLQTVITEYEKKHPGINQRVYIQDTNFKKAVSSFETSFSRTTQQTNKQVSSAPVKFSKYYADTYKDVYDQFGFSYKLRLKYIDRNGGITQRDITVNGISMYDGDGSIEAYCHLRKGQRTFKMERITECIDLETGEFVDDAYRHLKSKYEASPEKSLDVFFKEEKDIMRVLEYIGRADGQLRREERLLIYDAFRKISHDDRITDEMFKNAMEYTDAMNAQAYKLAITRLSSKPDNIKAILSDTARAIVATQKTVLPAEQEALDYITKKWGITVDQK